MKRLERDGFNDKDEGARLFRRYNSNKNAGKQRVGFVGNPCGKNWIQTVIDKFCEHNNLLRSEFRFYSFRHTAATNLAASGASAHEIIAALGHASVQTSAHYVASAAKRSGSISERMATGSAAQHATSATSAEPASLAAAAGPYLVPPQAPSTSEAGAPVFNNCTNVHFTVVGGNVHDLRYEYSGQLEKRDRPSTKEMEEVDVDQVAGKTDHNANIDNGEEHSEKKFILSTTSLSSFTRSSKFD